MVKSSVSFAASAALLMVAANAAYRPNGKWPTSTGKVKYTEPYIIKAGEVFDGKMQTFDRSDISCTGGEGQKDSAVFLVEAGGTLKNAIIGKHQKEGVHCSKSDCTIENVWWDDVCEDALSIKGGSPSSVSTITNCGARYAEDKVVQHNGYGTVKIKGFFAQEFGQLYRSCGTCGDIPRTVTVEDVYAVDPKVIVTVNKNYGDQATLKNIHVKTTNGKDDVKVCRWSQGSKNPAILGNGPSAVRIRKWPNLTKLSDAPSVSTSSSPQDPPNSSTNSSETITSGTGSTTEYSDSEQSASSTDNSYVKPQNITDDTTDKADVLMDDGDEPADGLEATGSKMGLTTETGDSEQSTLSYMKPQKINVTKKSKDNAAIRKEVTKDYADESVDTSEATGSDTGSTKETSNSEKLGLDNDYSPTKPQNVTEEVGDNAERQMDDDEAQSDCADEPANVLDATTTETDSTAETSDSEQLDLGNDYSPTKSQNVTKEKRDNAKAPMDNVDEPDLADEAMDDAKVPKDDEPADYAEVPTGYDDESDGLS
ncbi:unnamed protein product [Peronospora belbahrii]|uniref:Probable pectate lyase F n=1 Tax=Peronospora belbahrii TaxID=622444 RepID=A0ABN8CVH6_9STRA|nr:unnamed protein product [Peronospora belbahrii]